MIRLLGIIFISLSVGIYGYMKSKEAKYTQRLREDILNLFKAIERDIKYGNRAVSEILSSFKADTQKLEEMIEKISSGNSIEESINEYLSSLSETERDKAKNLLTAIGKSRFSEEELIQCKNCIDFFENNNAKTQKDAERGSSLYAKLGLIGSILMIIILI